MEARVLRTPLSAHEGAWAPDGLTYYGGDLRFTYTVPGTTATATGQYFAVDTADPTHQLWLRPGPPTLRERTCMGCRSVTTAIAATSYR